MSKADRAKEAAEYIREEAFATGIPTCDLISHWAGEYSLEEAVIESWLCRDPGFISPAAYDLKVSEQRAREARELDAKLASESALRAKLAPLGEIIDAIPKTALFLASLNVVGLKHAQEWRTWIEKTCSDEVQRKAAKIFASGRIITRMKVPA